MGRRRKHKEPTFSEALVPFRMASSTTSPNTSRSKASTATGSPSRVVRGFESAIRMKSASRVEHSSLSLRAPPDTTSKGFCLVRGLRSWLSTDEDKWQRPRNKKCGGGGGGSNQR